MKIKIIKSVYGCENCGCVFDKWYAKRYKEIKDDNIIICPACKYEYEISNNKL